MKNTLRKLLLFLLVLIFSIGVFSISVFAADTEEDEEPKYDSGLKFEVADDVQQGGTRLRIKVSGTPKSEAVKSGSLNLSIPADKVTTNVTTTIPVEMENSTFDIQNPRATLEEPLYIYGVKDTDLDTSSVILADNFTFKKIAPGTDISSWIKFPIGRNADGTKKYIYASELDTDKNKNTFGEWIIPKGLKYEVDEAGTEAGENSIGIRIYGIPDEEIGSMSLAIDLPTNIVTRANPYSTTVFTVDGDNMELSGMVVSNVLVVLKDPEPIIGTAYFPLTKEYTFTITLDFQDTSGKFPTFTGLSVGDDISSWFSDTIKGAGKGTINYTIKEINNNGGTSRSNIVIGISGTPAAYTEAIPKIYIPRANIAEIKDDKNLPENFVVTELGSGSAALVPLQYQIAEYPASTAFSVQSTYAGTVGVPYSMDTTVKFNAVDAEVPLKFDNRHLRIINLNDGVEFNKAFKAGDDITSWFTNAPSGMKFTVASDTKQYATSIQVYASGTPEKASSDDVSYLIPSDVLSFTGTVNEGTSAEKIYSHERYVPSDGLLVSGEKMSKYAIYDIALENPQNLYVKGPATGEIDAVTATVKLGGNLRFKTIRLKGNDISSWFKNVWASTPTGRSDQFTYTLETDIQSGTSSFTFKVLGSQGDNGLGGAGLFAIEIPSDLLQDTSGATLPTGYNYRVAVSTSYSDIAEEYARIYLATPVLKIISEDRDMYVTESFYGTFTVSYQLDNAKFDTDAIDTDQVYYAWANNSLRYANATDDDPYGENYVNLWTYYGPGVAYSVESNDVLDDYYGKFLTRIKKNHGRGYQYIDDAHDASRGLGVKVESVTENQITIKYYGFVREDFEKRGTEQLFLNIPRDYILDGPTKGVTSTDAVTLHYEKPVIAFAPYGFYADRNLKKQEVELLKEKVNNDSKKRGLLSYDLVGVVGQDLSEYSYDIENNYEGNRRNEEYHYYLFAPLNFDMDYDVGDDVTSLFFNDYTDRIGITWKVVAKVDTLYNSLNIRDLSCYYYGNYAQTLLDRPVDYNYKGYIYVVKAEGIPNFHTDNTYSDPGEIKVTYHTLKRDIAYSEKFDIRQGQYDLYRPGGSFTDPLTIESQLAPSYTLEHSEFENSRVALGVPSYRFFGIYVPFKDWTYSVVNTAGDESAYTTISGKAMVNDNVVSLSDVYNSSKKIYMKQGTSDRYTTEMYADFIPIIVDGNYAVNSRYADLIWTYQNGGMYGEDYLPFSYYIWRVLDIDDDFGRNLLTLRDPRVARGKYSDYYLDLPIVYHDQHLNTQRELLSGDVSFLNYHYYLSKDSDGRYTRTFSKYNSDFSTPRYNEIFYIGFRPASDSYSKDMNPSDLKLIDMVEPFELWINSSFLTTDINRTRSNKYTSYTYSPDYYSLVDTSTMSTVYVTPTTYVLSSKYDFSLPQWLKVTPSDPYISMIEDESPIIRKTDIVPGVISSGSKSYRALMEEPIAVSVYQYQDVSATLTINLINTSFTTFGSGLDVASWFNFPEGVTASVNSVDSEKKTVTINVSGWGEVVTNLTTLEATVPAAYNESGEDLNVYTKGSTFEVKSFSASFEGEVSGFTNKELKNNTIKISFSNGMTFNTALLNKDITSWFTSIGGVKFVVTAVNDSTITVVPQGKPSAESHTDSATIQIPLGALADVIDSSMTIFTLEGLKYSIYDYTVVRASIPEKVVVYTATGLEVSLASAFLFNVSLQGTIFADMPIGKNVSSWFGSSKKTGLNYVLKSAVKKGDNVATIAVYGTTPAVYTGSINITIPSDCLYSYSDAVSVDTKSSVYQELNQTASIVGSAISISKYRTTSITQDFTIELKGGPGFIAISKGYNVSSWFNTILTGDVTYKVLNAVNAGDKTITIRMSTSSATASTYDTAKAYTITIPKIALIYATDSVGVDVKGGTMRFNNYSQPAPSNNYYVWRKQKPIEDAFVWDPNHTDKALVVMYSKLKSKGSSFSKGYIFKKDNGKMESYHYFLFPIDNIQQVGHTENSKYSYIARYTGYSYLSQSSDMEYGVYKLNRPWTRTTVTHYRNTGNGNYCGAVQNFGAENYSLADNLPEVYISPRANDVHGLAGVMDTDKGKHILNMIEIWTHVTGSAADFIYDSANSVVSKNDITNTTNRDLAKKSFQVLIYKSDKCDYGKGKCSLFINAYGKSSSNIGIDFKVPVIDLAGNKVWMWYRYKGDEPGTYNYDSPIQVGHYTGWDVSVNTSR